jgi:membrane dipeptidase
MAVILAAVCAAGQAGEGATVMNGKILTIDSHIDIPPDFATPAADPGRRGATQVDLDKMEEGGLAAGFFIVYVRQGPRTGAGYARARDAALTKFAAIRRMTDELYPDRIGLALTAADARRIHAEGKLIALIGIENGYVIGRDLSLIERYYQLGARYMTLAHDGHNDLADSARAAPGEPAALHGGLSELGRTAIAKMNRLGMLVDISHVSRDAALETIAASSAPVIASHSSVRTLYDHPRNLDDETMRALAAKGGVMQIVAYDSHLRKISEEETAALKALLTSLGMNSPAEVPGKALVIQERYAKGIQTIREHWPRANLENLGDHIDYAVRLLGIDHVGIASDFGGGGGIDGWDNAAETGNVTAMLTRRGYSDADIEKLWGGNLLRALAEAAAVAGK